MPRNHEFQRDDVLPSWWANAIQDIISGAQFGGNLTRKNATTVQVLPAGPSGLAAVVIDGRWRFNDASIERAVPGNGTYTIWAVALDNDITDSPDPFTDHTDYGWDLRMTSSGTPSGTGVEIYAEIGTVTVAAGSITALKQTAGAISGGRLADDAISGTGMTVTRQPGGGLLLALNNGAVGTNQLANGAVTEGKLGADAVTASKIKDGEVGTAEIGLGAVATNRLQDNAVQTAKILDAAVSTAKLAGSAVKVGKIDLRASANAGGATASLALPAGLYLAIGLNTGGGSIFGGGVILSQQHLTWNGDDSPPTLRRVTIALVSSASSFTLTYGNTGTSTMTVFGVAA